MIEIQ